LTRFTRLNNLRLRTKLLVAYLGLTVVLFTIGGLGALFLVEGAVKAAIENDLRNGTRAIINLVETTAQGSITTTCAPWPSATWRSPDSFTGNTWMAS
jgi:hypothetical protein